MDGRKDERTDGLMVRWMDLRMGGWKDRWMDERMDGRIDGQIDGWTDERTMD